MQRVQLQLNRHRARVRRTEEAGTVASVLHPEVLRNERLDRQPEQLGAPISQQRRCLDVRELYPSPLIDDDRRVRRRVDQALKLVDDPT